MLTRTYAVLSWLAIGLGVVHLAATPRYSAHFTQAALWFAAGGLLIILTGALNLLNRGYGREAAGLRWLAAGTNIVVTLFSVLMATAGHPTIFEYVVVLGLFGGLSLCSLLPGARVRRAAA